MSVHEEKFGQFCSMINEEIGKQGRDSSPTSRLTVDLEANVEELFSSHDHTFGQSLEKSLQLLEPFGPGNRKPMFYSKNAQLVEIQPIGIEGAHLKMSFKTNGPIQKGIGFGLGKELAKLQQDTQPVIAYSPMANRYRNTLSWEVRVTGLHFQNEQDG
jgi:single-stranded-DNA-specific exonuclease